MATPTRFTSGITTTKKTSNLGNFGMPDPTKWHVWFEDFDSGLAVNASKVAVTKVGTGTYACSGADGSVAVLTNTAADNDSIFVQEVFTSFVPATGKRLIFKALFTVSDITQTDWIMGLYLTDTTPFSTGGGGDDVTDGIYFGKEDGGTGIDFYCQKDTTTGQLKTSSVATQEAAGTMYSLGFEYDGIRTINIFKNDVQINTIDLTATPTTYLPDTIIKPSFGLVNGEAVAKTMTIDYVFVAQER